MHKPVNDLHPCDYGKNDKPKPEENVDFLIDNIERQHAKTVELFHCARRTKFVESAFRHFGKDSSHGILSLFGTQLCHCKNVSAISCKLPCKNKKTNLILKFSTDFFSLEYLQQNYVSKQQVY